MAGENTKKRNNQREQEREKRREMIKSYKVWMPRPKREKNKISV